MVAMQQRTLLQKSEHMKQIDIDEFQRVKKSEANLKMEEIGELLTIEAIEKEMKLIGVKKVEFFENQNPAVDLRIEYLEFDTEQQYKSTSHVSVIKYGAVQRFPNLAPSKRRELRVVVLGVRNLTPDWNPDQLMIKLTIIRGDESKPLKAKSEAMHAEQRNVRFGHFFVIQDIPTNKFSSDYLYLSLVRKTKSGLFHKASKPKQIQTVSLLAPIHDTVSGKNFQLQDLLGKPGHTQLVSVPLSRSSTHCSDSYNQQVNSSWRTTSVRKNRED